MAISVKKALKKYGVTWKEFNTAQDFILRVGAKELGDASAALAVHETWQTATKEDEAAAPAGEGE
ncbi:MAG: hypothetical protein LBP62_03190 [Clostridiales bacterium]|jgi:hypothetical protein|nr:hypothetical protein [Clostridiales bacterium]